MTWRTLILTILILANGCLPRENDFLEIDSSFSSEEQAEIIYAADAWSEACDIELDVTIAEMTMTGPNRIKRHSGSNAARVGTTEYLTGSITLWPEQAADDGMDLSDVAAHEIGHWLRNQEGHLPDGSDNIMADENSQKRDGERARLTSADVDFVCP